ncbi:portal protein [Pacificispira sp.]|uniref:portal protein n=1 Tax=Pacificispira sp. TaxID=2888761 RepID=UPI003BA9E168
MDQTKAAQIKKRYKLACSKKEHHAEHINESYLYTYPAREPKREAGESVYRELYDSTATKSADQLISTILSFLIPNDSKWAVLDVEPELVKNRPHGELRRQLAGQTTILFHHLNQSNFYIAAAEALKDVIVAGSACLAVEYDDSGLRYTAVPVQELAYMDNGRGDVDTVFRDHELPARTLVEMYPDDAPQELKDMARDNPDKPVPVIESMTPNGKRSDYALHLKKGWHKLFMKTVNYMPFVVFRWTKGANDTWGDSPVRQTLAHIKTANKIVECMLDHGDFAAHGAWFTDDEGMKDQTLYPGAVLYTYGEGLKPIPFPGDLRVDNALLEQTRAQIREGLYSDALPPPDPANRMTTAEVTVRQGQFLRSIGPNAIRLEKEFLKPIVLATIRLLQNAGVMESFKVDAKPITLLTYSLVRRQMAMEEITRTVEMIGLATSLFGPIGLANIDVPKLTRHILEAGGVSPQMLKPMEQVEQEMQAINTVQAMMGAQQAQSGQGNPETAQATGQALGGLVAGQG